MPLHQSTFRPTEIYLVNNPASQKRRPEDNLARFYVMRIQPTLFGHWALRKCWGQIGTGGFESSVWFDTEEEALNALLDLEEQKKRHGYRLLPVQLKMF